MFPSETMKRTATLILALRRFWATAAAGLAFVGAIVGGLAVRRSTGPIGTRSLVRWLWPVRAAPSTG
jgi:hypothetical protein